MDKEEARGANGLIDALNSDTRYVRRLKALTADLVKD